MTQLPYSALGIHQRTQVAYLFADEIFGSDANAYLYELSADGDVTQRCPVDCQISNRARKVKVTHTEIHIHPHVNAAQVAAAQMHMDALAASIAENVYQHQLEEVTL